MTTPAFVPQDSSSLTAVRYYTQFDPYYYTVDNRPLQDLASNITTISSGGGDSARRASLISQLNLSEVFRSQYPVGAAGYVSGLAITSTGANNVRVNPGAWYFLDNVNTSDTDQIVKQALLLTTTDFTVTAPLTGGQSIDYLIQIQSVTLNASTMPSSALPYLDATNTFLPGLLLNGELKLSLKAGTAAATGSQVTPAADAGWTPLYVVTSTNGATSPSVKFSTASPSYSRLNSTANIQYPGSGSAIPTYVNGLPVATFADSAAHSIAIPIPVLTGSLNPLAPIKLTLVYSTSVNTGNANIQASYLALAAGGSTSAAVTSLTAETIPAPGTANTLSTVTLTAKIPNTAFAGFNGVSWQITAEKVYLNLTRDGNDGADTLAGDLFIHDVIISQ